MKVGADNKIEVFLAVVLAIGAVLSVTYWITSSSASTSTAPPKASVATSTPATTKKTLVEQNAGNTLDPQLRLDLLKSSEEVRYQGAGRNIFVAGAPPEIPKPVSSPLRNGKIGQSVQPQGPPPPPPIELKFFGFASRPGEPTKVFLSHGDNVFVAREGDIVDRQYRVVKIGASSVEIEDVLHNNRQSIPLIRG